MALDSNFYKLNNSGSATRAEWSDDVVMTKYICPMYPEHNRPGYRSSDLLVVLPSTKVTDFIWTWFSELIITDKVVSVLNANNITGFETRPVTVRKIKRLGKDPRPLPPLWEMKVTGKGGHADPACGIVQKNKCEYCKLSTYSPYNDSIIINPDNWDGSDFFTINGFPRYIFITERVKELIQANKFKGCELKLPSEMKWPSGVIKSDISVFEYD